MGMHQYRQKPAVKPEVTIPENGFLTVQQAAKYLNLSLRSFRKLVKQGQIKRAQVKALGHLFTREELDRYRLGQNGSNPAIANKKFISLDQLVQMGLSEGILRDYVAHNKLKSYKLNGALFFNESDVEAFLEHRKSG